MPESPMAVTRRSTSAFHRFLLSRAHAIADDDKRLAIVAGLVALVTVSLGIVAARVLGGDFPAAVFVIALLVAGVGVFRPYFAVLGAIFVSPTFGWATFGPDISPFQVLVAGAVIGCLFELRPALLRRLLSRPEVVLAILFFTSLVIAAGMRRGSSDWAFVRNYFGAVVFFGTCAITIRTAQRRRYAVGALVAGCTATAAVGLVQLFTTDALVSGWVLPHVGLVQDTYERLGSPWGLSSVGSDYGKDVLIGFLVLVPLILRPGGRSLVPLSASLVLAVGLAMSGSRSAWLAATVALLYVAVVSRRLEVAVPVVVIAGALVFLIARPGAPVELQSAVGLSSQGKLPLRGPRASTWQPPRLVIGGTKDRVSTDLSNDLRRRLTRAGLEMVRDQPVFGVGAGAFKNYVDVYEPIPKTDRVVDARRNLSAHNVPMEIWAGSGTPTLLLYLAFVGAVLLRLHRSRSDTHWPDLSVGLTAALLGVLVASLFHNYQYDNLLWALCGVAASLAVWGRGETGTTKRAAPAAVSA
jgi:O-antigen ligase